MELGSEYNLALSNLSVKDNNLFSRLREYDYQTVDYGRSAIRYIGAKGEVLLPEYICESVIRCFAVNSVIFYKVREDFTIDFEDLLSKVTSMTKAIFVAHYFGAKQPNNILKNIKDFAKKHQILLIEDTTQSLFSVSDLTGDVAVASVRKWMPIPMGGIIYSKKRLTDNGQLKKNTDNRRAYGMILKDLFLQQVGDFNSVYRDIFAECEKSIDNKSTCLDLSDFTRFLISCVDVNELIARRKENYAYVKLELKKLDIMPAVGLVESDCPFVFPIRVPNRNDFRKYLIDKNIYCAVHWPFDGYQSEKRIQARLNAQTLISLPIDQRYTKKDMDYLLEKISEYGGALTF